MHLSTMTMASSSTTLYADEVIDIKYQSMNLTLELRMGFLGINHRGSALIIMKNEQIAVPLQMRRPAHIWHSRMDITGASSGSPSL
ncbi:MAG: hypothetical protein ACLTXL_10470 [Clostridia bacterium]